MKKMLILVVLFCLTTEVVRAQLGVSIGLSSVPDIESRDLTSYSFDFSKNKGNERLSLFFKKETYIKDSISLFNFGTSFELLPPRFKYKECSPYLFLILSSLSRKYGNKYNPYAVSFGVGFDFKLDNTRNKFFLKTGYRFYSEKIYGLNLNGLILNTGLRLYLI